VNAVFVKVCWAILAGLVLLLIIPLTPLGQYSGRFELFPGIPLIAFGIALVIMAAIQKTNTILKFFLIATGASAIGWPSSLFLHSFLFQYFPTEPVTYVLFFYVFPMTFVISTIGSLITGLFLVFHRKLRKPTHSG
jgi:hypothetical protein